MAKDYGQSIGYDPLWRGPSKLTRKTTDFGALVFYLIFLGIWFGIGVYAFILKPTPHNQNSINLHGSLDNYKSETEKVEEVFIKLNKWLVGGFIGLSGLLSLLYILMMRWWAKLMTYTIIFVTWISMIAGIVLLLTNPELKKKEGSTTLVIFLSLVLVVTIILVLAYRKTIAVTCAMIQEATKTALYFPSHFLLTVITFAIALVACALAFFISNKFYLFDKQSVSTLHGVLHLYNFCATLWSLNFMFGVLHMMLSTSFGVWYWTINKKYVANDTVIRSVHAVFRYHLGTVALGSLIITICEIIKTLLRSIARRSNGENAMGVLIACFSCCCEGLMNFIEYISSNAYVMCAVHGTDFFTSAKSAFNLIMRNVKNVVATTEIASMLFYVGVMLSSIIPAAIAAMYEKDVNYSSTVFVIVFVSSLILSSTLFLILRSAVETIFICVIEDYERNDGSEDRPYFMSNKLRRLLLN